MKRQRTKPVNEDIKVAAKDFAEAFEKLMTTLLRGATDGLERLQHKAAKRVPPARPAVH